jgi:hypothetical protein
VTRLGLFYGTRGTSENAAKSQIWIALSVYVLVAIAKKRLALPATLYEILQILSLTLFEKTRVAGVGLRQTGDDVLLGLIGFQRLSTIALRQQNIAVQQGLTLTFSP